MKTGSSICSQYTRLLQCEFRFGSPLQCRLTQSGWKPSSTFVSSRGFLTTRKTKGQERAQALCCAKSPVGVSEDMPTAEGKLRVLGLHGWRTSGKFLQWQFDKYSRLGKKLDDMIEVTYIDAPHQASGPIPDGVTKFVDGPYHEWWNATKRNETEHEYEGMEQSLDFVLEYMRLHGPFDGVMGFSQGGTVSGVIAAYCQGGMAHGLQRAPKFYLIFAGLLSRDHRHLQLYNDPINAPAFIVYGEKDPGSRYTKKLAGCFTNPVVITHPGGHVVPPLGDAELEQMRAFLATQQDESKM